MHGAKTQHSNDLKNMEKTHAEELKNLRQELDTTERRVAEQNALK